MKYLIVVLISLGLSWTLLGLLIPVFRRFLIDQPNFRSSHYQPTPRGGGVVIVLLATIASILACFTTSGSISAPNPLLIAPLIALPLSLVGFLDDIYNLPASYRYVVQLATVVVASLLSPLVSFSYYFLPSLVLILIAATGLINFVNFMDGLDGLVAGCLSVCIAVAAYQLSALWPIWVLLGALLGFLPWNWSPAKVFLGDVGSTYLGAVFAVILLQSSSWQQMFGLLLVATPLIFDAGSCVLRRLLAGHHIFRPHRLHLFQRLHQAGWTHHSVSLLYIFCVTLLSFSLLYGGLPCVISIAVLEIVMGIWLDRHVAVPFSTASSD